jgi:hypothetical protein
LVVHGGFIHNLEWIGVGEKSSKVSVERVKSFRVVHLAGEKCLERRNAIFQTKVIPGKPHVHHRVDSRGVKHVIWTNKPNR